MKMPACRLILVGLLFSLPETTYAQLPALQTHTAKLETCQLRFATAGKGSPTVVFIAGMGEDLSTWKDVQPAVAEWTRTLSYDRAGLGASTPAAGSRDAQSLAQELHRLLRATTVPGPYLLVGHSLGTYVAAVFTHLYPNEVSGLVLVDPAYRESRLKAMASETAWAEREATLAKYMPPLPPEVRREKEALELSGEQAAAALPLPPVPALILTATKTNPNFPLSAEEKKVKVQEHAEWLATMPTARQVIVPESRHYIQNDAPQQVIVAIQQLIKEVERADKASKR